MKKYKHIFFDLDHTLWDFESNSAATLRTLYAKYGLKERGIDDFEGFRSTYEAHNERFWERFRKGYINRKELRWKRMFHTLLDFKIGDIDLAQGLSVDYLDLLPHQDRLMPYALDLLEHCRDSGYAVHLITNGFEATQWQKMRNSGIDHYFAQVITSENSQSMKPKPGIFKFALMVAGAKNEESIMIGDNIEADMLGALSFGMDQIYYNPRQIGHGHTLTHEVDCLSKIIPLL